MGGLDQLGNLLVAIQVGTFALVAVRQQSIGRNLSARIHRAEILCKATHHAQASGPVGRLATGGLGGPLVDGGWWWLGLLAANEKENDEDNDPGK